MVVHLFDIEMVMGSNLGENKIKLSLCQNFSWHECERIEKTLAESAAKEGWKNSHDDQ